MWVYRQSTGELFCEDVKSIPVARGYAGFGECKNKPDMQHVPQFGPIPRGRYQIGKPYDTETHGPHVMRLTSEQGTETFGRDGFLIHGDSVKAPGTASHGCIILSRQVREFISKSGDTLLEVIA